MYEKYLCVYYIYDSECGIIYIYIMYNACLVLQANYYI